MIEHDLFVSQNAKAQVWYPVLTVVGVDIAMSDGGWASFTFGSKFESIVLFNSKSLR